MSRQNDFLRLLVRSDLATYEAIRELNTGSFILSLMQANRRYRIIQTLPTRTYLENLWDRSRDRDGSVIMLDLPGDNDFPGPDEVDDTSQRESAGEQHEREGER